MSTVVTLGPVGFKPTGAYNNTREYKKLDVVIYQGSSYVAKSDSIGQLPTNTTYWEMLVQKGDTGNGITSIAKTGTSGLVDTYTITYTDETTSTFTVTNGEKGDPGEVTQAQLDETNNQVAKANMVYNALPKVSDEGDNLTLDGTANCPMKMELKGNTEQTTYTGKNLFDGVFRQGGRYTTSLSDTNRLFTTQNCPIKSGVSYTISTTLNTSNFKYAINLATVEYPIENTTEGNAKQYYDSLWKTSSSFTFTPSQDGFLGIVVAKQNGSDDLSPSDIASVNWQLEEGSTATDYEPYCGGTPSPNPDYPQPVKVVTGNNTINVCGKNLFNPSNVLLNEEIRNSVVVYSSVSNIYYMKVNIGTKYNFSKKSSATSGIIGFADEIPNTGVTTYDRTGLSGIASISKTATHKYLILQLQQDADLSETMVEVGNTKTTYEPYQSQTYPINLGTIELCKIGDYQDYIYKDSGKWYKHSEICKVVLDGSEDWNIYNGNFYSNSTITDYYVSLRTNYYLSNAYQCVGEVRDMADFSDYVSDYSYALALKTETKGTGVKDIRFTTTTDFTNWLSTHNTIVYYVLATPTNTEITDTTLISQLNAIENAVSYDTQTNIVQENYSEPFIINAECVRSLKDIFELIG